MYSYVFVCLVCVSVYKKYVCVCKNYPQLLDRQIDEESSFTLLDLSNSESFYFSVTIFLTYFDVHTHTHANIHFFPEDS